MSNNKAFIHWYMNRKPEPPKREVEEGRCENCNGIGEVEARGEMYGCHECNGTGLA
jgi:hypothetical protein